MDEVDEIEILEALWENRVPKKFELLKEFRRLKYPKEEKSDDQLAQDFDNLSFAGFKNFADCRTQIMAKKGWGAERASAYCASIARQVGEIKTLSSYPFILHMNSWMGQIVVRGIPKVEYYLRIKTPDGIRSFYLDANPMHEAPVAATDEGIINKKWFDFEGKLPPSTIYNPNKKISANMIVIDKGTVDYTENKTPDGITLSLKFSGKKFHGKWEMVQEEKGADFWTLQKLSEVLVKLCPKCGKEMVVLDE